MDFNTSVAAPSPVALDIRPPQSPGPLETLAQLQELKRGVAASQLQALQQREAQMNLDQRQAVNQAYRDAFTPQPDGSVQLDTGKLTKALATGGHGEAIPGIMEAYTKHLQSLAALQETNQKVAAAEADTAGTLAATVKAAGNDPAVFHTLLTDAVNRKVINGSHFAPFDQAIQQAMQQDPTGAQAKALVGQFTDQMIAGSPKQQELANAKKTAQAATDRAAAAGKEAANNTAKTNAELPGITADSQLKAAKAAGLTAMTDADWQKAIDDTIPDKKSPLYGRTLANVMFLRRQGRRDEADAAIKEAGQQLGRTETAAASAKATAPFKIEVAGATQNAAADAASAGGGLDMMAEQALNGQFSNRNPILTARVYNRAAELAKDRGLSNTQVVMERNAAAANKGALNSLTKQYETLKPFEDMAIKNAAILEEKSQDVANLGAPFLNTPIRELEQKFLGNAKVTAFKAAMQPVQADFARILNSPTGSGVLSDDARHEMQAAISPAATPAQIKAALDVFRRDAQNRRETYDAAVSDLRGRTTVGTTQGQQSGAPKAGPSIGDVKSYQGHDYKFDGKQWVRQ